MMRRIAAAALVIGCSASAGLAQVNMPDLRQMSGVPLPSTDLPAGTVSVRVVRGSFANNVADATVTFLVDNQPTDVRTDAMGRAEIKDVRAGARLKAFVVVDGERLDTQEVTIGASGFRFILSSGASASAGSPSDPASAGPPVKGAVVFGPESRVIAQFSNDSLFIFYVVSILNSASAPVDIGGPITFELPEGARGAVAVEDSSPQATVNGSRVVVRGPFAPGTTRANIRFELPYSGPVARIEQRFPAPVEQLVVFALKTGQLGVRSPQLAQQREVVEQGQPLIVASGPGLAAGEPLTIEITGLPYHPAWPRNVALAAAGVLVALGLWAGLAPSRSRARARTA
jgi:hypothetical protein